MSQALAIAPPHAIPSPERIIRASHESQRAIDDVLRSWRIATDIKTPLPLTGDLGVDIKMETQRRADIIHIAQDSDEHKWWWVDECRKSFWVWRDNFCYVFDEKRRMSIPYLSWDFHSQMQAAYLGLEHDGITYRTPLGDLYFTALAKSREMGGTVGVVAPMTWTFAIDPEGGSQYCVGYVLSNVDSNNSVWTSSTMSKIRWMLKKMPAWLLPESWRRKTLRFVNKHRILINEDMGIALEAETSDVERIRSKRGFRVWIDEANSIPHLDRLVKAAQKVGPLFMTSSVTHRGTYFARLVHGDLIKLADPGKTGGLLPLRIHYTQHPRYNPATEMGRARIAEEKASMTTQAWSEEMEIDYSATSIGKIWDKYYSRDTHVARRSEVADLMPYLDQAEWCESWDFGESATFTVWLLGAYFPDTDELYIMSYRSFSNALVEDVVSSIATEVKTNLSPSLREPHYRVGDMMGKHARTKEEGGRRYQVITQWRRELEDWGVEVEGQILNIEGAIKLVSQKLKDGKIIFMPSCAQAREESEGHPSPAEAVENYSRWIPKGMDMSNFRGKTPKPAKDIYSHMSDALQHMAYGIPQWRDSDTYKDACRRAKGDQ